MKLINKMLTIFLLLLISLMVTSCSMDDLMKPDVELGDIRTDDAVEITEENFGSYYQEKLSEGINKKFFSGINKTVKDVTKQLKKLKEWFEEL